MTRVALRPARRLTSHSTVSMPPPGEAAWLTSVPVEQQDAQVGIPVAGQGEAQARLR